MFDYEFVNMYIKLCIWSKFFFAAMSVVCSHAPAPHIIIAQGVLTKPTYLPLEILYKKGWLSACKLSVINILCGTLWYNKVWTYQM